jgi:hypothetical protein
VKWKTFVFLFHFILFIFLFNDCIASNDGILVDNELKRSDRGLI